MRSSRRLARPASWPLLAGRPGRPAGRWATWPGNVV